MKALYISNSVEKDPNVNRLMGHYFPKIQLTEVTEKADLVELLTLDGPYSFILIHLDNKLLNASQVREKIISILGTRPFVLIGSVNGIKAQMTDEILSDQTLNILIETPINTEHFKKSIETCLDWSKKEEFEQSILELTRDDLHPMRLRNFYLFDQLPYDVYLELTSTKYGKIISQNKFYSHQIIQNYSRKNIKYLYLKKDEHLKFLDTSVKNLLKIYEAKIGDRKKYITIHLKTAFIIHQFIKTLSVSDDVIKLTHAMIDTVPETVRSFENLHELLEKTTTSENITFAEQSILCTYICEFIMIHMGWNADMSRGKLSLASLLQDVTLNNDDLIKIRSLNDPDLKLFSELEQEEFKNHPTKAANLSTFFTGFSDVDFILNEHHEHPTGDGFPKGMNSSGLTTISCIFILANHFVSKLAKCPLTSPQFPDILKNMKRVFSTGNFKDPLKALEKSLKR